MGEFGPRALGNRSILYDARDKDAKQVVNKVKRREWYRPFAGSILKEYATGQKSTAKEISKSKERKQNVRRYESPEGQGDYVIKRQGEADDYYTDDYDYEGE